jgi:RNA polymerase sigma factor (sigma-70 family)
MATVLSGQARDRAFERLYERYVTDVYRYALAVLRNPDDAEDVTQTTFMNAYRAYKQGEEPIKPQNWLIKIAHNACRTRAIRASRRPSEVPLDESMQQLAVPEQERPNLKNVLAALGRLPFNQRSALVMRELEGRSYDEIADTLGVSVAAVETLIFRARRSLRLRRDALRGLTAVPLPASLQSFGSGAVANGGYALGGSLVAKAAAVLAALVAGGASFEAVNKATGHVKPSSPLPIMVAVSDFQPRSAVQVLTAAGAARPTGKAHRAVARPRHDPPATISTLPAPLQPVVHPPERDRGGAVEPSRPPVPVPADPVTTIPQNLDPPTLPPVPVLPDPGATPLPLPLPPAPELPSVPALPSPAVVPTPPTLTGPMP